MRGGTSALPTRTLFSPFSPRGASRIGRFPTVAASLSQLSAFHAVRCRQDWRPQMPSSAPPQLLRLSKSQAAAVDASLRKLAREDFIRRFLAKDPTLWKQDEAHGQVVRNRMGWLDAAGRTRERLTEIQTLAEEA